MQLYQTQLTVTQQCVSVSTSGSKGVQRSNLQPLRLCLLVSVSTSGSKGVQPTPITQKILIHSVSVSTSGSKGVQQPARVREKSNNISFSIHKRIEGGATPPHDLGGSTFLTFQYPQADRRGCNQPDRLLGGIVDEFQYPQADRRGCNKEHSSATALLTLVSVSTSGSKGVQRDRITNVEVRREGFQYPQADRRGCNYRDYRKTRLAFCWFQYPQADRRGCNHPAKF